MSRFKPRVFAVRKFFFCLGAAFLLTAQPVFAAPASGSSLEESTREEAEKETSAVSPDKETEHDTEQTDSGTTSSEQTNPELSDWTLSPERNARGSGTDEDEDFDFFEEEEEEVSSSGTDTKLLNSIFYLFIINNLFSALNLGCLCASIFSRYLRG